MRVFIISKGRAATATTGKYFEYHKPWETFFVVPEEERYQYLEHQLLPVICSPVGFPEIKDWILETQVQPNEWVLICEDDIIDFWSVIPEYYWMPVFPYEEIHDKQKAEGGRWRQYMEDTFNSLTSPEYLHDLVLADIRKAEELGVHLIGYAANDNPMFRKKKYRTVAFIIGRTLVVKPNKARHPVDIQVMEDYAYTAEHFYHYGRVLCNNYIHWKSTLFQEGGLGNREQRYPLHVDAQAKLLSRYGNLFGAKERVGRGLPEVRLRLHNEEKVQEWQMFMRELRGEQHALV